MEYLVLIQVIDQSFIKKTKLYLGKSFVENIKNFLPPIPLDTNNVKSGYIYLINSKKESNESFTIKISIQKVKVTENYIFLEFMCGEKVELEPELLRVIIRKYLKSKFQISQNQLTPYMNFIPVSEFEEMLNSEKEKLMIENYFRKKQWKEIYDIIKSLDKIEETCLWSDPLSLNKIAFSMSKLSECSINLKKSFKSNEDVKKFLSEKREYRNLTEKFYKRWIEIDNFNPQALSSLAYFYYQSALELTYPGGRRDDNLFEVINKSLLNFKTALELDFNRLNDHYRIGNIFYKLLYPNVKYFKSKDKIPENYSNPNIILQEAINAYEKVIDIYESDKLNHNLKKVYLKTYIKTLYNIASLLEEKINTKSEKLICIIKKIFPIVNDEDSLKWKNYKTKYLLKSLEYSEKCIRWVNKKFVDKDEETSILNVIDYEDSLINEPPIDTNFKVYQLAKIYLKLFLINNNKDYLLQSKALLQKAIQLKNRKGINILFVYNLLAMAYIFEEKYELAIKILSDKVKKEKAPDYIKITFIIALIMNSIKVDKHNENQEEANKLIDELSMKKNKLLLLEVLFWKFILDELTGKKDEKVLQQLGLVKLNQNNSEFMNNKNNRPENGHKIELIENPTNIYQKICLQILKSKEQINIS